MSLPTKLVRHHLRHVSHNPPTTTVALLTRNLPTPRSISSGSPRRLATVKSDDVLDTWFTGSAPRAGGPGPNKQQDERKLKLGKTLRILQERLPTLLQSPLPQELLSPHITLHLFPSTHPHLPTVSGRVAYTASLWTTPMVWGRVPLISDVKLEVLSERMIKSRCSSQSLSGPREQLIVRWRTVGKTRGKGVGGFYKGIGGKENVDKITEWLGGGKGEDDSKEFTGLFIFEFDEEGRVLSHTIEHAQEGGDWEKGVGARVVGLTDWLLGGLRNGRGDASPCPAFWRVDRRSLRQQILGRR